MCVCVLVWKASNYVRGATGQRSDSTATYQTITPSNRTLCPAPQVFNDIAGARQKVKYTSIFIAHRRKPPLVRSEMARVSGITQIYLSPTRLSTNGMPFCL